MSSNCVVFGYVIKHKSWPLIQQAMAVLLSHDVVMVWGYFINLKEVKREKFLGQINLNAMQATHVWEEGYTRWLLRFFWKSGCEESADWLSKFFYATHKELIRTFSRQLCNWWAHLLELNSLENLFPSLLQRALSICKYSTNLST